MTATIDPRQRQRFTRTAGPFEAVARRPDMMSTLVGMEAEVSRAWAAERAARADADLLGLALRDALAGRAAESAWLALAREEGLLEPRRPPAPGALR